MRGKKAKELRKLVKDICGCDTVFANYVWLRRPDQSVYRQLRHMCPRATYQELKSGKGKNRVRVVQQAV